MSFVLLCGGEEFRVERKCLIDNLFEKHRELFLKDSYEVQAQVTARYMKDFVAALSGDAVEIDRGNFAAIRDLSAEFGSQELEKRVTEFLASNSGVAEEEALRCEVNSLRERCDEQEKTIEEIQVAFVQLRSQVLESVSVQNAHTSRIATIEKRVATVEGEIESVREKCVAVSDEKEARLQGVIEEAKLAKESIVRLNEAFDETKSTKEAVEQLKESVRELENRDVNTRSVVVASEGVDEIRAAMDVIQHDIVDLKMKTADKKKGKNGPEKTEMAIKRVITPGQMRFPYMGDTFNGMIDGMDTLYCKSGRSGLMVSVTARYPCNDNDRYHERNVLDLQNRDTYYCSEDAPGAWFSVSFGDWWIRHPTHYSIRTYFGGNGGHLRSWVLEGSDGSEWHELDRREDNANLNGPYREKTFAINKGNSYDLYQSIRLRMIGKAHDGSHCLRCSGFEVFGERDNPPPPVEKPAPQEKSDVPPGKDDHIQEVDASD